MMPRWCVFTSSPVKTEATSNGRSALTGAQSPPPSRAGTIIGYAWYVIRPGRPSAITHQAMVPGERSVLDGSRLVGTPRIVKIASDADQPTILGPARDGLIEVAG